MIKESSLVFCTLAIVSALAILNNNIIYAINNKEISWISMHGNTILVIVIAIFFFFLSYIENKRKSDTKTIPW